MVRHKNTGELFLVSDLGKDEGFIAAICKSDAIVWDIEEDLLELIPHPDTVRLNWLINNSLAKNADGDNLKSREDIDLEIKDDMLTKG